MFINAFAVIAMALASVLSINASIAHNATASVITSTEPVATQMPAVLGIVSSTNGTSLIVGGKAGRNAPLTTYAVTTNGARIYQQTASAITASSLANIKKGEQVTVVGTISGKTVTALGIIIDLVPPTIKQTTTS